MQGKCIVLVKNVSKIYILYFYCYYYSYCGILKGSEPCEPEINDTVARQPVDFKQ